MGWHRGGTGISKAGGTLAALGGTWWHRWWHLVAQVAQWWHSGGTFSPGTLLRAETTYLRDHPFPMRADLFFNF